MHALSASTARQAIGLTPMAASQILLLPGYCVSRCRVESMNDLKSTRAIMFEDSSPPPLIILQVTLTFWEPSPQIDLSLIRGVRTPGPTENWQIPARELGVPDNIDVDMPPLELNLPPQITSGIKNSTTDD